MVFAQENDGGDQQQFIGEGIQNGAQFANLVEPPGHVAIHPVQQRRDPEGAQGESPVEAVAGFYEVEHLDHKERNQQNPDDGYFVGRGHAG